MNSKKLSLASLCLVPLLLASCMGQKKVTTAETEADAPVEVNALSIAVSEAQQKVNEVSKLSPGDAGIASVIFKKNINFLLAPAMAALPEEFGDDWDINTPFQDPAYCGPDCSVSYPTDIYYNRTIKYWLQAHLDKDFRRGNGSETNVFGKIRKDFEMVCIIGQLLNVKDGGYPKNGDYSLKITKGKLKAITSACDMTIDDPERVIGQTIEVAVSDTATSTFYDKKIALKQGNDGHIQSLLFRKNSQFINIYSTESGGYGQYRTLIKYDLVQKKLFFEYISAAAGYGDNSMYVYRIFHDENADKGYLLSLEGGGFFGYSDVRFTLAGKPRAGGTVALSMTRTQFPAFNGKKACFYLADGSIAIDGELNCTIPGVDVDDPNLTAVLSDAIAKRNDTDWATLDSEIGIDFTNEVDMFSVNVTK